MRSTTLMAILVFSALLLSTSVIEQVEAGKKKLLKMLLMAKLAGSSKKIVLLPIPFAIPIKKDWHVSVGHGWHGGHGWW